MTEFFYLSIYTCIGKKDSKFPDGSKDFTAYDEQDEGAVVLRSMDIGRVGQLQVEE
jgi:hypothetical protein